VNGSRDLLLKFWDPLHITETVEARNFKFGTVMDGSANIRSKWVKWGLTSNLA